jgi:3-methyladenine DNA glycosylase AlkD
VTNATEVLRTLESKGKPNMAKIYQKHGVVDRTYGVSYADLGTLAKRIGTDHALAEALWKTGVHEARVLAAQVADPESVTGKQIAAWLGEASNYIVTDAISELASRMPGALGLARDLVKSKSEQAAAAGWNVFAKAALEGRLEESEAKRLIGTVKREIHGAKNRVRHAMNGALIAIGGSKPSLSELALAAARSIGRVEVDHGQTGCVTPDAVPYIQKMLSREKDRASMPVPKAGKSKSPARPSSAPKARAVR